MMFDIPIILMLISLLCILRGARKMKGPRF